MIIKRAVKLIGYIELLIGLSTLLTVATYAVMGIQHKSVNVLIFVIMSSAVSIFIGTGLLKYDERARQALVFFSGYVLITKCLILSRLLIFNGEILTFIHTGTKNSISILYHCAVIIFFLQKGVKKYFKPS